MTTRRGFLMGAAATTAAFAGIYFLTRTPQKPQPDLAEAMGRIVPDPDRVMDLRPGFSYQIVSKAGDVMADGLPTPGRQDGMACFPGSGDEVILVCNHELGDWPSAREVSPFGPMDAYFDRADPALVYDHALHGARAIGGTSTIVYNVRERRLVRQFLSLAGTFINCAGGPTPWGSWLSCEEFFDGPRGAMQKPHGYVFEVPARAEIGLAEPIPLKGLGRFVHEAACVDPKTGYVYLTQDAEASCLYRFIPDEPGNLRAGGTLQALVLDGNPGVKTNNLMFGDFQVPLNTPMKTSWITLDNPDPVENNLAETAIALGAAEFTRGEGIWMGDDEFYFCATDGGQARKGQIWRYRTGENTLELFLEPNDANVIENIDNITIAPWGDLIVCEDGPLPNYLRGVTPEGQVYNLARSDYFRSEFAGACFSPDGSTLFVNLQDAHMTLAITGPWESLKV